MGTPSHPASVSVKFSQVGRVQTFLLDDLPAQATLAPGDPVVVQTDSGSALGTVVRSIPALASKRELPEGTSHKVLRRATKDDLIAKLKQQHREQDAHRIALLKIQESGQPMKLTKIEQSFDGSRLILYFTAEGRVDFRDLLRDLASQLHTRIEMRQIGVRDEAKMLGGYGSCGRPLCCTTWLQSFEPISIKMAKQQDLSLNPSKLSGLCGRLKCCLRYELPNAKGLTHAGCGNEGGCSHAGTAGGCGAGCGGACGEGGCGNGCGGCH